MYTLYLCLLVCIVMLAKDTMAISCYSCSWTYSPNDDDTLTDKCYTGVLTSADENSAPCTTCKTISYFEGDGQLTYVKRTCDSDEEAHGFRTVVSCTTNNNCNGAPVATVSCGKCDWYVNVSATENCRTGEDVQDQIDLCAKCSTNEHFSNSSGELVSVRRTCGLLSLPDECEYENVIVDGSELFLVRRCGCSGDLCNTDSGSDGAPYLSLTMIIVMIASFVCSQ